MDAQMRELEERHQSQAHLAVKRQKLKSASRVGRQMRFL